MQVYYAVPQQVNHAVLLQVYYVDIALRKRLNLQAVRKNTREGPYLPGAPRKAGTEDAFTREERRILDAAPVYLRVAIILPAQTGGRTYSEGFSLRWSQVDFEGKLIRLTNNVKTPG
jgi:integrase